jgi:peptidoglycan/xylan/chitin deacetylase (PgdA/CDA1 family)
MTGLRVALTFDAEHPDRPAKVGTAETIVATLQRHEVRASFFVQGRWAEAYPELVGTIAGAGHLVGHHSYYHARMPLLTDHGIGEDLRDGAEAIQEAAGIDPRPWFRCPFGAGAEDLRVQAAVAAAGYRHVGWHVAADDWEPSRSATEVEGDVVAGVRAQGDGAVVLLHTWPTATLGAIGPIIDRLRDAGAEFCRVDELSTVPAGVPA